eukprot:TRINITY_DN7429_c0_g1_i2.p1 TRINITY_DN7429_c0_g1~~TRINITY_DN7429_c0_g1_i2.p1  ORF type:complete len:293 (+),score=23.61 TRINITY_DN7429_c0_g1_i2:147-1025(+)
MRTAHVLASHRLTRACSSSVQSLTHAATWGNPDNGRLGFEGSLPGTALPRSVQLPQSDPVIQVACGDTLRADHPAAVLLVCCPVLASSCAGLSSDACCCWLRLPQVTPGVSCPGCACAANAACVLCCAGPALVGHTRCCRGSPHTLPHTGRTRVQRRLRRVRLCCAVCAVCCAVCCVMYPHRRTWTTWAWRHARAARATAHRGDLRCARRGSRSLPLTGHHGSRAVQLWSQPARSPRAGAHTSLRLLRCVLCAVLCAACALRAACVLCATCCAALRLCAVCCVLRALRARLS